VTELDARRVTGDAVRRVQRSLVPAWRAAVRARATDVTEAQGRRSALVLAPHPDDETLGCGALIARKRAAGTPVRVVVVGDGSSSHPSSALAAGARVRMRAAEVAQACRILGVGDGDLTTLGVPDDHLADEHDCITGVIGSLVDDLRPDDVFLPSARDWHPDHQALNRAALAAVAAARHRPRTLEYCVWWWCEGPWLRHSGRSAPAALRDLVAEPMASLRGPKPERVATDSFAATKGRALAAHRSQTENVTGEPDWAVLPPAMVRALTGAWEVYFPA
jgi:LmbE family N-acetylglucosaminyl deacetylase